MYLNNILQRLHQQLLNLSRPMKAGRHHSSHGRVQSKVGRGMPSKTNSFLLIYKNLEECQLSLTDRACAGALGTT